MNDTQELNNTQEATEYLKSQGVDVVVYPNGEVQIDGGWIMGGKHQLLNVARDHQRINR